MSGGSGGATVALPAVAAVEAVAVAAVAAVEAVAVVAALAVLLRRCNSVLGPADAFTEWSALCDASQSCISPRAASDTINQPNRISGEVENSQLCQVMCLIMFFLPF